MEGIKIGNTDGEFKNWDTEYKKLLTENMCIFQGLGKLRGKHTIRMNKNMTPVKRNCRNVPFEVRKQLKQKLDIMVKQGIISKVEDSRPDKLICDSTKEEW